MRNEKLIWLKLKKGDRKAFEVLFRYYHQDLYRYGTKFCGHPQMTEDEIQNLFLKLWMNRKTLGDVTAVKTYLWTALRRRLITRLRETDREQPKAEGYNSDHSFCLSTEEFIIKKEQFNDRKRWLEKAIGSLSPKQKEVLYLKFYEGMSYEEIEKIMGVNYQVTRNYLYQGLEKLRQRVPEAAPSLLSMLMGLILW